MTTSSSIAWDRQNPQFHHHYHYGTQYPGNYPIYNNLYSMSRNGYKVAGIYIATQCIIFLVCCSVFLLVMGAVMTGLGVSIDQESGGTSYPQNNPLKVAGPITITMAIVLLVASTMLCVCAYREGMKVANASRASAMEETVTRSTHAYGEPGNPANNLVRVPGPGGGFGFAHRGGGAHHVAGNDPSTAADRLGSSEIAYIAPLPPPYAHPPTITANIYPVSSGMNGNGGGFGGVGGTSLFASIPESRLASAKPNNARLGVADDPISLPGVPTTSFPGSSTNNLNSVSIQRRLSLEET